MATISIYPNNTGWAGSPGTEWNRSSVGSNIKQAFSSTIKATGTLKDSLASMKKQIDGVSSLVDMSDSSAKLQVSVEREETKEGALSLAYDKIEEYMAKVERVDDDAKKEIRRLKENFYKRYSYLKPDCEKTEKELRRERFYEALESFGEWISDVGTAIKNVFVGVVEWCREHVEAFWTIVAVVVVAVAAAFILGPAAVIAVCSAIAFFCGMADLISVGLTGKSVATNLRESGHPFLAEVFTGIELGSTIAASVISIYSLGTQVGKVGVKHFLTGGEKGLNIVKYHAKNIISGFKDDISAIVGPNLRFGERMHAAWNIIVLNQSGDFNFSESISAFRNGQRVIRLGKNNPYVELDADGNYIPKGELVDALREHGFDTDIVHVKKSGKTVDYDWSYYAQTDKNPLGNPVGKANISEIYGKNSVEIKGKNELGGIDGDDVRKIIWREAKGTDGNKIVAVKGMTKHEAFNVRNGEVSIYQIPTDIHNKLKHNGGVSYTRGIWKATMDNSLFRRENQQIWRGIMDFAFGAGTDRYMTGAYS